MDVKISSKNLVINAKVVPTYKDIFDDDPNVFVSSIDAIPTQFVTIICEINALFYKYDNQDTIDLLKQHGCKMGLCTKVDVATLGSDMQDSIFKLPRLDVNDLPKDANAEPNKWYELA